MKRATYSLICGLFLAACQPESTDAPAPEAQAGAAMPAAEAPAPVSTLDAILAGEWRDPANAARDSYRHPKETLAFFGVEPTQTVVEIWPGGGWYTEILAPYVRGNGKLVAVVNDPAQVESERSSEYFAKANERLEAKFAASPDVYDEVALIKVNPVAPVIADAGSVDTVLTFRNAHNWIGANTAEAWFKAFFDALKPGGTLGVVDHRQPGDVATDGKTGYVTEQQVIDLAEAAGFRFDGKSEINANFKDKAEYPEGVWTLPPVMRLGDEDRQKYLDIGESDRMTLRFVKPE